MKLGLLLCASLFLAAALPREEPTRQGDEHEGETKERRDTTRREELPGGSFCTESGMFVRRFSHWVSSPKRITLKIKPFIDLMKEMKPLFSRLLGLIRTKMGSVEEIPPVEGEFTDDTISVLQGLRIRIVTSKASELAKKCKFPKDDTRKVMGLTPQGLVLRSVADVMEAAQAVDKYKAQGALINANISNKGVLGEKGRFLASGSTSPLTGFERLIIDKDAGIEALKGDTEKKVMCFGFRPPIETITSNPVAFNHTMNSVWQKIRAMQNYVNRFITLVENLPPVRAKAAPKKDYKIPSLFRIFKSLLQQVSSEEFFKLITIKDMNKLEKIKKIAARLLTKFKLESGARKDGMHLQIPEAPQQVVAFFPNGKRDDDQIEGISYIRDDPPIKKTVYEIVPLIYNQKEIREKYLHVKGNTIYTSNNTEMPTLCNEPSEEGGLEACAITDLSGASNRNYECGDALVARQRSLGPCPRGPVREQNRIIPMQFCGENREDLVAKIGKAPVTLRFICGGVETDSKEIAKVGNTILKNTKECHIMANNRLLYQPIAYGREAYGRDFLNKLNVDDFNGLKINNKKEEAWHKQPWAMNIVCILATTIVLLNCYAVCHYYSACRQQPSTCCVGSTAPPRIREKGRRAVRSRRTGREIEEEEKEGEEKIELVITKGRKAPKADPLRHTRVPRSPPPLYPSAPNE